MKSKWLLWLFYIAGYRITVITEREEILLFLACGILYMLIKAPPQWIKKPAVLPAGILISTGFWKYDGKTLQEIAWFFAKAGAFVFGSGLAIVPFLHGGVVKEFGWLNENQFVDAVAVAMITPGPVVITVGFIGYLVAGFPGACVAALATFLPCYFFTVALAPSFKKIAKNTSIKAFVDGITAAVIGALVGSVIIIGCGLLLIYLQQSSLLLPYWRLSILKNYRNPISSASPPSSAFSSKHFNMPKPFIITILLLVAFKTGFAQQSATYPKVTGYFSILQPLTTLYERQLYE
jgi:putative chromate ion transporter